MRLNLDLPFAYCISSFEKIAEHSFVSKSSIVKKCMILCVAILGIGIGINALCKKRKIGEIILISPKETRLDDGASQSSQDSSNILQVKSLLSGTSSLPTATTVDRELSLPNLGLMEMPQLPTLGSELGGDISQSSQGNPSIQESNPLLEDTSSLRMAAREREISWYEAALERESSSHKAARKREISSHKAALELELSLHNAAIKSEPSLLNTHSLRMAALARKLSLRVAELKGEISLRMAAIDRNLLLCMAELKGELSLRLAAVDRRFQIEGDISIHSYETWNIDDPSQPLRVPVYSDKITDADGKSLKLAPTDYFVEFRISAKNKKIQGFPEVLYLPSPLFQDKKEGDVVSFQFCGQLVKLSIQESKPNGVQVSFEDALRGVKSELKRKYIEAALPLDNNPIWWYRLGDNGSVFGLVCSADGANQILTLEQKDSAAFRPLKQELKMTVGDNKIVIKDNIAYCCLDFAAFHSSKIDIILNETHLIVYGESNHLRKQIINQFPWKGLNWFKDLTLGEMKLKLLDSSITLENGVLTLAIKLT